MGLLIRRVGTLKNVTIGVYDYHTGSENGALGLGWGRGVNTNHSTIVDELVDQGVVQTKAFGLALGDKDGLEGGSLVLGGVDTKKFSGALQKVPVIEPPLYPFDYSEYRYGPTGKAPLLAQHVRTDGLTVEVATGRMLTV